MERCYDSSITIPVHLMKFADLVGLTSLQAFKTATLGTMRVHACYETRVLRSLLIERQVSRSKLNALVI